MADLLNRFFSNQLVRQGLRYAVNCGISLGVKLALVKLLFLAMDEQIAYAVVQIPIFVFSYYLHSKRTFLTPMSVGGMFRYLRVMVVFQIIDYAVFTLAFSKLGIHSMLSVLIATIIVFVVRFLFVRRGFYSENSRNKIKPINS